MADKHRTCLTVSIVSLTNKTTTKSFTHHCFLVAQYIHKYNLSQRVAVRNVFTAVYSSGYNGREAS